MRVIHCDYCHREIGWRHGERVVDDYHEVVVTRRKTATTGDPESNDVCYDQFRIHLCGDCLRKKHVVLSDLRKHV